MGLCMLCVTVGIICIFEAASNCLEGLSLSIYFGAKTTQRGVPAKVRDRKLGTTRTKDVGYSGSRTRARQSRLGR